MGRHLVRRVVIATLTLAGSGLLASCSSSGASTPKFDLSSIECVEKPEAKLGKVQVCVDTGIRNTSLFSFSNWGGRRYPSDDFGFTEMVALYGEENVCSETGGENCEVLPKARLTRDVINAMLQNGRCEGLTSLGAMYMTSKGPDPKNFGASGIQALNPSNKNFSDVIDYWWATQLLSNVTSQSKNSRKLDVDQILMSVIDGLVEKKGVTVGLYSDSDAHSVLPVAVTRTDKDNYAIIVWDSNNPSALSQIKIDLAQKTWSYANARVNTSTAARQWTGGKGTIDVVSLDMRNGSPIIDLEKAQRGDAMITATASSNAKLSLTIKTKDGNELLATASGQSGTIAGAEVIPMRTGDTSQLIVTIPIARGDFSVTVSATDATDDKGSTQLTVDSGGNRAMSLSIPGDTNASSATVSLGSSDSAEATLSATAEQSVSVTTSTQDSLVSVPLGSGDEVTIAPSTKPQVDSVVEVSPASGKKTTLEVALPTEGSTQDVVVVRMSDGSLRPIATSFEPIQLDRESLTSISEATDTSTASTNSVSAPIVSERAQAVQISNSSSSVTDTTAVITSRVTSEVNAQSWVEYGPNGDWTKTSRTEGAQVSNGEAVAVRTNLDSLIPGTEYRYRTAAEVDGSVVYSTYGYLTTTGEAPDEFLQVVSDANIKVESSLVAATATGGLVASKITTPVASKVVVEYSLLSNPTVILRSAEQSIQKSTGSIVVSALNGLTMGQSYRYRVVVSARGANGYSAVKELTTGSTIATERLSTSFIGTVFSFSFESVTQTSATVVASLTGPTAGRLQVEVADSSLNNAVRTRSTAFAAGTNIRVSVPVENLKPNTTYYVRLIITSGGLTQQTPIKKLVTLAPLTGDTSGGRLSAPLVPRNSIEQTTAAFTGAVRSEVAGRFYFEYGIDNPTAIMYQTLPRDIAAGEQTVGPLESDPVLRAGNPYRVRSVLVVGNVTYQSAFTLFTTAGVMDNAIYRPTGLTLRRTTTGVSATWSMGVPDVPSILTFALLDGSTTICTAPAGDLDCDGEVSTRGTRSMVVAAFRGSTEIARSDIAQINIGGTPTISGFSVVTATNNSLTLTYSFDPQGETVQYGIEVRTASDQFVKADLGGTSSVARNGVVHVVSGLSPTTTYKVRLVLVYGSNTRAGDWTTTSTS